MEKIPTHAKLVIIGGGILGISLLYHLAKEGWKDVTGGFLAMDPIKESGRQIQLIFKDFKADFLKRPEGDVHFYCNDGLAIRELVEKTVETGERQNYKMNIEAVVPSLSLDVVARFELTLSLKDKTTIYQ